MRKIVFATIYFIIPMVLSARSENWIYRYDGPAHTDDVATDIIYGADDNIYIAGYSHSTNTLEDLIVISLSTAGDTNWLYRYNGPGDSLDRANAIAYGADGNLYIAGDSYGLDTNRDFIVISLTTSGDTNWIYRYNGSANAGDGAKSVVYGADGNIYAAGWSSGTETDFTVISLTPGGNENWIYVYNGPANSGDVAYSLVYGSDGNIYAAGSSQGSGTDSDFTVISLSGTGDSNWVYRYNGSGNYQDHWYAILYGTDGNIYAAGDVCAGVNQNFIVLSLADIGDTNWTYIYDGMDGAAYSLACGSDSSVYAAGYTSDGYPDFTVVSLTPNGTVNWEYMYNGSANFYDAAYSLVQGDDGIIYIAGGCFNAGTDNDFTVMSLASAGDTQWIYTYDGPVSMYDCAGSVAYGADGNIYAAGNSIGNGTSFDLVVVSLPSDMGIKEKTNTVYGNRFLPCIVRGHIVLPKDINCKIFDITGRQIHTLDPAPGIYFIEVDGEIRQKVIKIK
jgi:uncharacterized delta-60 repeat protein